MLLQDLHVAVPPWRERWITHRQLRVRGVWDAHLVREHLNLQDGRQLTYFLDGPTTRENVPYVLCLHAMFMTGNSWLMSQPPTDYVLVCVNRPGYCGTDLPLSQSGTYEDFAHDIQQLVNHLNLDKFYIVGHSSGGPCALACAAHLPNLVQAVAILSGDPEYAHDTVPSKRWINRLCLGTVLPGMLRYCFCWLPLARGAVRGMENDYRLETARYSFHTEDIHTTVHVTCGAHDTVMPLEMSYHVHKRLPNSTYTLMPHVGHLGLLRDDVLQNVFARLVATQSTDAVKIGSTKFSLELT